MSVNNDELVPLSKMSLGQKGIIVAFSFDTKEGEQTQELGFSPGEQLEIVRYMPPGDIIEIKVREYFFSLSKHEADRIKIKPFF